jgi:hypothetical protein
MTVKIVKQSAADVDPSDETLFVLRASGSHSCDRVIELLEKAQALGFDLEKGSVLENFTVTELEHLLSEFGVA